jgi:HTH-type transcriptional regulator/antitoxin HipB
MRIRAPIDIGNIIRERRKKLGLDQAALAKQVGVSRQWIVEVEKGKPRAEIGLVLRTLNALGIDLQVALQGSGEVVVVEPPFGPAHVDIDAIIDRARGKKE